MKKLIRGRLKVSKNKKHYGKFWPGADMFQKLHDNMEKKKRQEISEVKGFPEGESVNSLKQYWIQNTMQLNIWSRHWQIQILYSSVKNVSYHFLS